MTDIRSLTLFAGCMMFAAPAFAQVDVAQEVEPAPKITIALAQSDPTALMESIRDHMKAGRPLAMWAAMNPADRQTLQTIIHGFATKVDPAVYDEVSKLVANLSTTLGNNAKFFAGNPMLNQQGKTAEEMEGEVKSVVGVLDTLTKSSLASHAGLASIDLEGFLATSGKDLMNKVMEMSKAEGSPIEMPDFDEAEIGEPEMDGDTATIEIINGDDVDTVNLKNVQGQWWLDFSEELADAADEVEKMKKMTKQDAMQARGMVSMVAPMLKRFDDCETQEDFDEAVQQTFGMFMGMMMGGGAGGPAGPVGR